MRGPKLGDVFKRVLLVEDSQDICDFYKDFFDSEKLAIDIAYLVPIDLVNVADKYDVLITDWLVGTHSVRDWLLRIQSQKQLPKITIIATGMLDIEDQTHGLTVQLIYKPFDFYELKELMINSKENPRLPT